jgi:hypothetical protein
MLSYITLNNKSESLKKSSTILLATVLVVGFIGISYPSSIFAQEYYDDYETEEYSQYYNDDYESEYNNYEKYMKDDNSKPSIQKISCNNINNNNIDFGDATNDEAISSSSDVSPSFSNVDSQPDKKGDFVDPCLNNNNVKIITNNFNTGTTVNNNNLNIENNNAQEQAINLQQEACTNEATTGDLINAVSVTAGNISNTTFDITQSNDANITQINDCEVTQSQTATNANQSIADNDSVVLTSSSIANVEQPQAQSQAHVKLLQDGNGVEINKQGNEPIDIREIKSSQNGNGIEIQQQGSLPTGITQQLKDLSIKDSPIISQGIGDSPELTALEKSTKLKQQCLELLP